MLCELKRLFAGRGMWAAMLLAVSAILSGTAWTGIAENSETGNFLLLVQNALCSRSVYFLMPVVAVLPWSDSILSERKGGFLKSILSRCIRRVYVENKILTVALGAFLSWIIAGMAVSFLFFVFFFPMEKKGMISISMIWGMAAVLIRCGLIAATLGTIGGICAVLSESSYLAFGFPLVGYYFCIIIQERYFPDALWIYPPEWIAGSVNWGVNQEGLWCFLLIFLVLSIVLHGFILYGKIEEL